MILERTNSLSSEQWPLWRTVVLGRHRDSSEYPEALREEGCQVSGKAFQMLSMQKTQRWSGSLSLVRTSAAGLGLPDGATYSDICRRAFLNGLSLCPMEVGPALRIEYRTQPLYEVCVVAMLPAISAPRCRDAFALEHTETGLHLSSDSALDTHLWGKDDLFVFAYVVDVHR